VGDVSQDYEAPLFEAGEPRSENEFLISTRYFDGSHPRIEDVLRRHGVEPSAAYTHQDNAIIYPT
jgi:hypothetical protein